MPVKRLNLFAVGQIVFDDDDVSPACAGIFGKDYATVSRRVNRLAAVGIAARIFVPVLAEMIVCAEILRVVPFVFSVFRLGHGFGFADWISEAVGDDSRRRTGGGLILIRLRFGQGHCFAAR